MKFFIIIFSFIFLLGSVSFADEKVQLESSIKKIQALSKSCVPRKEKNQTEFCTGFSLTDAYLAKLVEGGVNGCRSEIQKSGFKIISEEKDKNLSEAEWFDFINSTQRALTFHEQRIVAFKKGTGLVDCVHELIHVFQQTKAKGELSAKNRQNLLQKIEGTLDKKVVEVESLEKQGQVEKAKKLAAGLSELINGAKSIIALSEGLDEVEAYLYVYQNCEKLACDKDDKETAIANLLPRGALLPDVLKESVAKEAKQIVKEKKQTAIVEANKNWRVLDANTEKKLAMLLKSDWDKVTEQLKQDGLKIVTIDAIDQDERDLLGESKILKGQALGKYLCKLGKLQSPTLVVAKQATVGTLVHEYGHFLQSKINTGYCTAIFGQKKVDDEFKTGKITRTDHDNKLLYYQAINALAEKEIYTFLLKHKETLDKVDNINNDLMLKSYNAWLTE